MLDRLRHVRLTTVALALYALATLVVGFAHKPVALGAGSDLVAIAAQADAPFSLCDHTGAPDHQQAVDHICDACALTSAPGLPPTGQIGLPLRTALTLAPGLAQVALFAPAPLRAPSSRGPPAA